MRPSVFREVYVGGYGWAAVFQIDSWTKMIVDNGPVQKSNFSKFHEILRLLASHVKTSSAL